MEMGRCQGLSAFFLAVGAILYYEDGEILLGLKWLGT